METNECIWDIYDDDTRGILGIGLYISGLFSAVLSCWLLAAFAKTSLSSERSYVTLLNFNISCTIRSLFAGFLFSGVSAVAHRWMFGMATCKFFGFLRQFVGTYQMEALSHMCIERYVEAKYMKNGREVTRGHYVLFISLCWFFSACYSLPQLFGLGWYHWDFSCTACNMDYVLPESSFTRLVVVSILLLGSIKPILMKWSMLSWARKLEKLHYNEKDHHHHLILTESTSSITWATMLSWTPGAITIAWVVISQLMNGIISQPPVLLAILGSICTEAAPGVAVLAAFFSNTRVRSAMMSLLGEPTHIKQT